MNSLMAFQCISVDAIWNTLYNETNPSFLRDPISCPTNSIPHYSAHTPSKEQLI